MRLIFVSLLALVAGLWAEENIDAENRAAIVHAGPDDPQGKDVREPVTLYNAVSGSAQIITDGVRTIPVYASEAQPDGLLKPPTY